MHHMVLARSFRSDFSSMAGKHSLSVWILGMFVESRESTIELKRCRQCLGNSGFFASGYACALARRISSFHRVGYASNAGLTKWSVKKVRRNFRGTAAN